MGITGEFSLLRQMWDLFRTGDVLLIDCLLSAWVDLVMLKQRGVDSVTRLNKTRGTADFRRGKRPGKDDHIIQWSKPQKPRSIDSVTYSSLPDYLTVREIRVRVKQPGFRTRSVIVVTTLLDPERSANRIPSQFMIP